MSYVSHMQWTHSGRYVVFIHSDDGNTNFLRTDYGTQFTVAASDARRLAASESVQLFGDTGTIEISDAIELRTEENNNLKPSRWFDANWKAEIL